MSKKEITRYTGSIAELHNLTEVLDDTLCLLNSIGIQDVTSETKESIYPGLFDQCLDLCKQTTKINVEPIRSIHHLSCTGGTLITKCLAAMPNVTVLNEVDPLSTLSFSPTDPKFTPTDLVSLARQGQFELNENVLVRIFIDNLSSINAETTSIGKKLLLRDHCHSHFLTGSFIKKRQTLLSILNSNYKTLSIVSVRDPIDSYLSLEVNGWLHFYPNTFDEYCSRYLTFLEKHEGIPVIKYEDFVNNPLNVVKKICEDLSLAYNDSFVDIFDIFKFSGDSGRIGNIIAPRTRRKINESFVRKSNESESYSKLVKKLEYDRL